MYFLLHAIPATGKVRLQTSCSKGCQIVYPLDGPGPSKTQSTVGTLLSVCTAPRQPDSISSVYRGWAADLCGVNYTEAAVHKFGVHFAHAICARCSHPQAEQGDDYLEHSHPAAAQDLVWEWVWRHAAPLAATHTTQPHNAPAQTKAALCESQSSVYPVSLSCRG